MDHMEKDATAETDNEFEKALEKSLDVKLPEKGQRLRGKILRISDAAVVIDCGATSEAIMDPRELDDEKEGDEIEVIVLEAEPTLNVSKKLIHKAASMEQLRAAFEGGMSVHGKITEAVKGGAIVDVAGNRAFLPLRQMDITQVEDASAFVGKSFEFKIIEFAPAENKLVVSRVEILKEHAQKAIEKLWEGLEEGKVVNGVVRSIQTFGAFVDIGGVEGLLHISEMSDGYITHPSELLSVGQEISVRILKADRSKNRISLSIKEIVGSNWREQVDALEEGKTYPGTITKKAEYGLFVKLLPGVEGLLHVSQLKPETKIDDPAYEDGKEVEVRIRSIDRERHRISLSMRAAEEEAGWQDIASRLQINQIVEGKIEELTKYGIFVEIEPGLTGLMPFSELRKLGYKRPKRDFPIGATCHAKVLSINEERRRIALAPEGPAIRKKKQRPASAKAKHPAKSKTAKKAAARHAKSAPGGVTEFGALLAKALKKDSSASKK